MTRLAISSLQKTYHDAKAGRSLRAIRGLDLDIASGEFISLLGPSGCGKTTTLRCIAGFEEPDAGAIKFDGVDIVRVPPERRDIGLVFQNYALFPHLTVAQNVRFGLEMRRIPKAEAGRRVAAVLETVQLGQLGERFPRQLSGGQQQRVALARALVIQPRILLLDEPLANLDARLRDEMRFFIRSLQQRTGITTIYVTHDQAEAMVMSDRVVVMFDGQVSQFDTPAAVYGRPATRTVADFVGLSNFLPGRVVARDSSGYAIVETEIGRLRSSCGHAFADGETVLVLLRPEAVTLSMAPPESPENVFPAILREKHFLGHATDFRLDLPDGSSLQVVHDAMEAAVPGATVWCRFPPDRGWVMPAIAAHGLLQP